MVKTANKPIEPIVKILLAISLGMCLFNMPYGFYELVRFLALVGFVILAYQNYEKGNNNVVIIYLGLAVLFQPFLKITLGREIWNFVDVFVGLGLVVSLFIKNRK